MVVFAVDNAFEATDGVLQGDVLAGRAGEGFGHEERLGQEALDFTGTRHGVLVFLGQLIHTENGNNVLQLFVALQHTLYRSGHFIVILTDQVRIEQARGRVQRIHSRVNTLLSDAAAQYQRGVQVGEGGGGRRVGQVVRGNVHGLEGRDRTLLGRRDAFLQQTHFQGQRRLIAHG